MKVGAEIRAMRQKLNVSQQAFAKCLDITGPYLSQIEHGKKKPSMELLELICQELGITYPMLVICAMEASDFPESSQQLFEILQPVISDEVDKIMGSTQ